MVLSLKNDRYFLPVISKPEACEAIWYCVFSMRSVFSFSVADVDLKYVGVLVVVHCAIPLSFGRVI